MEELPNTKRWSFYVCDMFPFTILAPVGTWDAPSVLAPAGGYNSSALRLQAILKRRFAAHKHTNLARSGGS
jgi:hypothetical protein